MVIDSCRPVLSVAGLRFEVAYHKGQSHYAMMRDKVLLGWFIRVNNNTEKFSPPNLLKTPHVCKDLFMIEGIHHFVKVMYILHSLQFLSTYRLNHFYSSIVCSVNVETCYENCVFCQEKEKWPFWLPRFIMHTFLLFSFVLLQQSKFCQVSATKFREVFITTEKETDGSRT